MAKRIDKYCRKYVGVNAVFERDSELDSWPKKSVQGQLNESAAYDMEDFLKVKQAVNERSEDSQSTKIDLSKAEVHVSS